MTTKVHIGSIFRKEVGDELFQELVEICPEGHEAEFSHVFRAAIPLDDPRKEKITNRLRQAGYRPWSDLSRPIDRSHEYGVEYLRIYGKEDWEALPLLELRPDNDAHLFDSPRREDGLMRLLDGYLKKSVQIGFTMPTWHVVPDRVKKLIEHSDLGGVTFKPTLLLSGTYADADAQPIPWDSYGEPWWELDANLTMPPLSDSMMFTDSDGRVLKERDFSNGFHRKEGLYLHPELHYRALDLAKLPPFDLARTYEPFGNRRGYDRTDCPLVASQRFYDFCEQHGLKTGWVPVRIEQD